MPKASVIQLTNSGSLGATEQVIKNVQPTAKAVLSEKDYTYRVPHLEPTCKTAMELQEAVDNVLQDLFAKLESITLSNGETVIQYLDGVNTGLTDEVFQTIPAKVLGLLSDGSLYSSVLKARLIASNEKLTDEDFTKPSSGGKSSGGTKAPPSLASDSADEVEL